MQLKDHLLDQGRGAFSRRHKMPILLLLFVLVLLIVPVDFFTRNLFEDHLWELACFSFAALGSFIRFFSNGYAAPNTSGREKEQPAAATLNRMGFYSLTRNPLYLGNMMIMVGVVASSQNLYLVVIALLALLLYYERVIMAEEDFLSGKFGDTFDRWVAEVPPLFPKLRGWQSPTNPFRWRAAFKREIYSITAIPTAILVIDLYEHYEHKLDILVDPATLAVASVFLATFLVFRVVKKKTDFFNG